MEIPEIKVDNVTINLSVPDLPDWLTSSPPQAIPIYPPVTQDVGLPIVDMPGCVEAHEEDDGKNEKLVGDDPKGVKIYCDAGMPSYNPIDYTPDSLQYEYVAPVPPVKTPEDAPEVEPPSIPQTNVPNVKIECPTEAQTLKEPIGTLVEGGTKKITEYRLVGTECIPIKEDITFVDQIVKGIPSTNQVTTTASIAVVATAAATATPFLLKAVKPIVKQIIKKIKKLLGKQPPKLSANEIQTNMYREKRGLPPLKPSKKKK